MLAVIILIISSNYSITTLVHRKRKSQCQSPCCQSSVPKEEVNFTLASYFTYDRTSLPSFKQNWCHWSFYNPHFILFYLYCVECFNMVSLFLSHWHTHPPTPRHRNMNASICMDEYYTNISQQICRQKMSMNTSEWKQHNYRLYFDHSIGW